MSPLFSPAHHLKCEPRERKSWGPREKKLGTQGEKIKGTKTFSPQNMHFHCKTRLLHRCVRLPQETSDWLASHWPTVDTLGQNRRLSTFVRKPARKKQLHPPQHKNYWVYHLDTLDTLDSGCLWIICACEKMKIGNHFHGSGKMAVLKLSKVSTSD